MVQKPNEFPERGELVVATVTKVNPFSVQVSMDEYGKEGMIHVSEVARKWVKDIREFAKVGQKIVAKVVRFDRDTGYVGLSLKRRTKRDSEERMKEFKRETKAERILEAIAKERKITLDEAYDEIGFQLQEVFGEMFKALQMSLTPEGREILEKKKIAPKWIKILSAAAEKQMEIKEVPIRVILEVSCPKSGGLDIIKKVLIETQKKYNVEVNYISAPKYSMTLYTKNPKSGEKEMMKIAEVVSKKMKASGGECTYERE
ncbi:MAG: S1 RNA-binding domain-containing protein [Candidatus Aenigmarchaeota archaeon]|nr:S1 RNA-binding domain-containing protein [Candidatus Aenigmarchaeota archaeon]